MFLRNPRCIMCCLCALSRRSGTFCLWVWLRQGSGRELRHTGLTWGDLSDGEDTAGSGRAMGSDAICGVRGARLSDSVRLPVWVCSDSPPLSRM